MTASGNSDCVDPSLVDGSILLCPLNDGANVSNHKVRSHRFGTSVSSAEIGMHKDPIVLKAPLCVFGLTAGLAIVAGPGVHRHEKGGLFAFGKFR